MQQNCRQQANRPSFWNSCHWIDNAPCFDRQRIERWQQYPITASISTTHASTLQTESVTFVPVAVNRASIPKWWRQDSYRCSVCLGIINRYPHLLYRTRRERDTGTGLVSKLMAPCWNQFRSLRFFFFLILFSKAVVYVQCLVTVFHFKISPDNSSFSHTVLPVLYLPHWFFQLDISSWKSPSALI